MIFFGHKISACRGQLDIDRNAGGPRDLAPVENIFWAEGAAPRGKYVVIVNNYCNHGFRDPTSFIVRVTVKGKVTEFNGQVTDNRAPVRVHSFTR